MEAFGDLFDFLTTADNWWGRRGILTRSEAHARLSLFSTIVAAAVAMPPAVWLGHMRRGGAVAVAVANLGRAVPSFAVLVLVFPLSLQYGFGLGFWPTCVALVVLGIPPIFTNTFTGISEVEPSAVEAARAVGMTERQVLRQVELPVARPLVITGLRIAAVQIVATATLGALVGFQGLGSFIVEGLAQGSRGTDRLLAGAVLVALMAIVTELAFSVAEKRATPWRRGQET